MIEKVETSEEKVCILYDTVISANYCALQHLLQYEEPIAYTTSELGWDADIYDFSDDFKGNGGVCICTGYRPFGDVESCPEMDRLYDKIAQYFSKETAPELRETVLHELAVAYIKVTLLIDDQKTEA